MPRRLRCLSAVDAYRLVIWCGRVRDVSVVSVYRRMPRLDVIGSRRGLCCRGRAPHVVVAEAARRAARARSSRTAAVAATRAAPRAIRVIRQPGMPPAVSSPPVGGCARPSLGITFTAQAAGMTTAEASRVLVTAARGRGESAQPCGNAAGRGVRTGFPVGMVCGQDGLLPVRGRVG
jgi:hypothetical protein